MLLFGHSRRARGRAWGRKGLVGPLGSMAAGFVLVGGHSSRMGRDKAFLRWHSRFMVEHVADQVASCVGKLALVGDPDRYGALGIDCFPDLHPGVGPLAGIEAALETKRGELNLIVACDMPDLETASLLKLLERAEMNDAQCLAARDENGLIHPLCAVYRSSCLPVIRGALEAGRLKLLDVLEELGAVTMEIGQRISNVNTPEEWSVWQQQARTTSVQQIKSGDGN
jgi:molybdopterin-guanine dinucleotide biosynthesis protein A